MNLFKILISLNPSSGFLILWGWQPNSSGDSQALRSPVLRHFLFHREPIPVAVSSSCIHPLSCQRSVLHRVFALCWSCFLSFIEWDSVCLQMVVVVGLVAKSFLTRCDPMDYSPPGFSVCGILQARKLAVVIIAFSRGSSQLRDWTWVSCIAGRFFTDLATKDVSIQDQRTVWILSLLTLGALLGAR